MGDRFRLGYALRGIELGARDRLAAAPLGTAVREPLAADTEDLSVGKHGKGGAAGVKGKKCKKGKKKKKCKKGKKK